MRLPGDRRNWAASSWLDANGEPGSKAWVPACSWLAIRESTSRRRGELAQAPSIKAARLDESSSNADSRIGRTLCHSSGVMVALLLDSFPATARPAPRTSYVSLSPERSQDTPRCLRWRVHQNSATPQSGFAAHRVRPDE